MLWSFALAALLARSPEPASSIDRDGVRKVIRAHIGEVRACYEEGRTRHPDLEGRVVLRMVVVHDGSVESASITESTLDDVLVESCIARSALKWKFFEGGRIVIHYPFQFVNYGKK